MNAKESVLQQLLDGKSQYRVPLFQRTYNWSETEWDRLWNDVLETYMMEEPRNHFIGAVVTQPVDDAAGQVTKYLLIDGQQRLTTLFIMLSCIRKKASQAAELSSLAEEIWEDCLVNKFAPASEDFIKLRPTQRDRPHFSAVINGEDTDEDGQVLAAFRYFLKRIDDGDLEGIPLDLRKLKSCISDRLDLVSITLSTGDSPHRIFESLNNTGMYLGASDLIRNLIFMNISREKEAQDAYDKHWFPMQEATGNNLDDFFWNYLMMNGSLPRWDEIFEEVKERFGDGGTQKAVEMLIDFSKFARYYRWICEIGDEEPQRSLLQGIRRLNAWEVSVAYPFLMRSLDWVDEARISFSDLVTVIKMIESFVVRRAVCYVPTNQLRGIFARMWGHVDFSDFVTSSRNYLLGNRWPSDDEFKDAFVGFHLYNPRRLGRTRLILESLEDSFGHREAPNVTEDITIEHVMPQTLTTEWKDMLGPKVEEVYSQWLHTPGNLTLTGYNSELGNASFYKKKESLECSKFSLTHSVLKYEQWDEDVIKARGEELAERAIQIWSR
ncbi:MAG: DUF262 domain-containing HNH endonuclease family protein [Gemmatimonadota bacterium]|nr:DUF262 domain-containing HNH endonuclease family protein [Gemmatimonadota bacterium]